MKYENKEDLKEKCIKLYLSGKTYNEIGKLTDHSRNYVANLIKDDIRIKEKKNIKTIKVYKLKNRKRMNVLITTGFLSKIGISPNVEKDDFVDIFLDENNKSIIIKKHE